MVVALVRFRLYFPDLTTSPFNFRLQLLAIAPCVCNIVGESNSSIQPSARKYMGHVIDRESSC